MNLGKDEDFQGDRNDIDRADDLEGLRGEFDKVLELDMEAIDFNESASEEIRSIIELMQEEDSESLEPGKAEDKLIISSSNEFTRIPKTLYTTESFELRYKYTITVDNKSDKRVLCGIHIIPTIKPKYNELSTLRGWWVFPAKKKTKLKFKESKIVFCTMAPGTYWLEVKIKIWGIKDQNNNRWPSKFKDEKTTKSNTWNVVPKPEKPK